MSHYSKGSQKHERDARGGPKKGHIHMHEFELPLPTTIVIFTHFSQKNDCGSMYCIFFFSVLSYFLETTDRFSHFNKLLMKNTLHQSCNSGDIQKKSKTYNFPIKINIF